MAVLGLGRMGRLYARLLAHVAQNGHAARLAGVADPDPLALAAVQAELRAPLGMPDPYALLARPEVEAVVVATPTRTHAELVIAAAGLGKSILCEKPLALSPAETRAALDAVERASVPLQVGFMRRFDPPYARAKALLDSGRIGRPLTFKAVGRDPFCPPAAYADPASSGGLLMDMAIHDFDLARWLMTSEVERVSAEGALLVCDELRQVGDVDSALVTLRFASGALGSVEVSRTAAYAYDIRTEVLGSEGVVLVGAEALGGQMVVTRGRAPVDRASFLLERFGDAYRAQLEQFLLCIRQGQPPAVTGRDALAAATIAWAATRALHTGRAVDLQELAHA